ncbi:HD domain-containing protein [Thermodesulfatator indicus]
MSHKLPTHLQICSLLLLIFLVGIVNEKLWKNLLKEAERLYEANGGSHRFDHVMRVLRLAEHLAKAEGADLDVVKVAALFHDIGRAEEKRTKGQVCHAAYGAEQVKKILARYKLPADFIEKVAEAIATHRFRSKVRPKTLEAKVLFDADKLDALGAVGIGRAFLFAGEVGARLHNPEVDLSKTESYSREDTAWREFKLKLSRIKDHMLTEEGRRLAEERYRFMEKFFERLHKEVAGEL